MTTLILYEQFTANAWRSITGLSLDEALQQAVEHHDATGERAVVYSDGLTVWESPAPLPTTIVDDAEHDAEMARQHCEAMFAFIEAHDVPRPARRVRLTDRLIRLEVGHMGAMR